MKESDSDRSVQPWARVVVLVAALVALAAISLWTTGRLIPDDPDQALLFQSSLLLVVLGTMLLERYFTRPADAIVNCLTGLITIFPFASSGSAAWWIVTVYLSLVLVTAIAALALLGAPNGSRRESVQRVLYRAATTFGRARVVFSVVFLCSIAFFVTTSKLQTAVLLTFWGVYIALWPLGIPQLLSRARRRSVPDVMGQVVRVDSPDLARVSLNAGESWPTATYPPLVVNLHDGTSRWALPLVSEAKSDGVWATLLLAGPVAGEVDAPAGTLSGVPADFVIPSKAELMAATAGGGNSEIVGLTREGSRPDQVRLELLPTAKVTLGALVKIRSADQDVYYQIVDGETAEEPFAGLHYGSQIAFANQVGSISEEGEFVRNGWMPQINAPAFQVEDDSFPVTESPKGFFKLGQVAGTNLDLVGDFVGNLQSHTALLGVTGSGKTEFAFDMIRHAVEAGVKVVCIDLTAQYSSRLSDLSPTTLSISIKNAAELGDKMFDVETGTYGAGAEKKALATFAAPLRADVETRLSAFLGAAGGALGLIELTEIANSKATLWVTEMYLSLLLKLAREGRTDGKVLVVVEEAHTVMPESNFLGVGDFDAKGSVAKISQIALQGRKYGVGLLVIAQRTATVSKSVLTQCNTVISFSCADETSIQYLGTVFGQSVANTLPSLKPLRAYAYGAWIRSQVPVAFDVPFDDDKSAHSAWKPTVPPTPETPPAAAPAAFAPDATEDPTPF